MVKSSFKISDDHPRQFYIIFMVVSPGRNSPSKLLKMFCSKVVCTYRFNIYSFVYSCNQTDLDSKAEEAEKVGEEGASSAEAEGDTKKDSEEATPGAEGEKTVEEGATAKDEAKAEDGRAAEDGKTTKDGETAAEVPAAGDGGTVTEAKAPVGDPEKVSDEDKPAEDAVSEDKPAEDGAQEKEGESGEAAAAKAEDERTGDQTTEEQQQANGVEMIC